MSAKSILNEARKAMKESNQDFIALVYKPEFGDGFWVAEDGRVIFRSRFCTKELLESEEMKRVFDNDGLKFVGALTGLYHISKK